MAAQGHHKGDEDPKLANMWVKSEGVFFGTAVRQSRGSTTFLLFEHNVLDF